MTPFGSRSFLNLPENPLGTGSANHISEYNHLDARPWEGDALVVHVLMCLLRPAH